MGVGALVTLLETCTDVDGSLLGGVCVTPSAGMVPVPSQRVHWPMSSLLGWAALDRKRRPVPSQLGHCSVTSDVAADVAAVDGSVM
jgi:hypothetical protein